MIESHKSINKFLSAYVLLSTFICIIINKFNILIPYYVAIVFLSVAGIFTFFISEIYIDIRKSDIYKDISVVFAYLGVLNLLFVIYNVSHNNVLDIRVKSIENIILLSEVFLFYLISHTYKIEYNLKKVILIITFTIIALYYIITYCQISSILEEFMLKMNSIVFAFCMIVHCINLLNLKKMNKYLNINIINDLSIIIISRLGVALAFWIAENYNKSSIEEILFLIIMALNIMCTYIIVKFIIRDVIKKYNNNFGDNKDKANNKDQLEKVLIDIKNKKDGITKYENYIYESLMLIPIGIVLCKDEKIIFINKQMKLYLNIKNEKKIIGFNYEELIISRSNKISKDKFSSNNIRIKFEDNEFLGEEFNIKDDEIDPLLNMIIIQDLDIKIQMEKLKSALEQRKIMELGRNEMLSNLSHEFKTPINIIYSTAQLIDLDNNRNDYKNLHEHNMIIKRNCDKLIRMINNFIDSTKFEANIINIDLKIINIVSLVEDLTMSIVNFAKNKNIEVVFDTNEEEIYILADVDFIERIILNILSNAIKYNRENGTIFVNIKNKEEKIIIEIIDTGFGIPEDKLDKLFSRFERLDNNNLVHEEGTGLGLNIVKQMVDALKGEIQVISKEDKGTTISVIFNKYNKEENQITDIHDDISRKVELELSDI